jgi:hypothetical protein
MLRAKSPRPLMRFSERISGTTCLMLLTLTLLTIPVIDLRRASQERRWYSGLLRSSEAAAWRARSRAGGMYTPPDREEVSFANSATASNSFPFAPPFLSSALPSSTAAMRAASWRSRSARRTGSTSSTLGVSTTPRGGGGDNDLRRLGGGALSGDRERDLSGCQQTRTASEVTNNTPLPFLRRDICRKSVCRHSSRHYGFVVVVDKSRRETPHPQLRWLTNGVRSMDHQNAGPRNSPERFRVGAR